MSEVQQWPPPTVESFGDVPVDVVVVVPEESFGKRKKRRFFLFGVVAVAVLAAGAVVFSRTGKSSDGGYSIERASVQLEDSKRIQFVASAVPDNGESSTERFRLDVDRRLVQIDEIAGEKVDQLGKSSTLADLDGNMFYVWYDALPNHPAEWLGGHLDQGSARYFDAILRFAPMTLALGGRFRGVGLESHGVVDLNGEKVTSYEISLDADKLASNPQLEEAFSTMGVKFEGTMTYTFFISKKSKLVKMVASTTVNGSHATLIYTDFVFGDDVEIQVPTDFHDMDAPLDSTP